MRSTTTSTEFPAPGPGGWRRLADHFPRALTAEYQRIYAETCPAGMASYMQRYGVLARTLDVAFVHGHLYITPVPLAGPRDPRRTPPGALVWLLSRLHPNFRRRNRAARDALEVRPWRTVTEHWFAVEREHGGSATPRSRRSTRPASTSTNSPTTFAPAASTSPLATGGTSSCTATICYPSAC